MKVLLVNSKISNPKNALLSKSQIITISELYDAGIMELCHNKLYIKEKYRV
jgi:hypothetical protein